MFPRARRISQSQRLGNRNGDEIGVRRGCRSHTRVLESSVDTAVEFQIRVNAARDSPLYNQGWVFLPTLAVIANPASAHAHANADILRNPVTVR